MLFNTAYWHTIVGSSTNNKGVILLCGRHINFHIRIIPIAKRFISSLVIGIGVQGIADITVFLLRAPNKQNSQQNNNNKFHGNEFTQNYTING